jgi:hypothetical protein
MRLPGKVISSPFLNIRFFLSRQKNYVKKKEFVSVLTHRLEFLVLDKARINDYKNLFYQGESETDVIME